MNSLQVNYWDYLDCGENKMNKPVYTGNYWQRRNRLAVALQRDPERVRAILSTLDRLNEAFWMQSK